MNQQVVVVFDVVVFDVVAPDVLAAGRTVAEMLNGKVETFRGFRSANDTARVESWWMPEEPLRSWVDRNDNEPARLLFDSHWTFIENARRHLRSALGAIEADAHPDTVAEWVNNAVGMLNRLGSQADTQVAPTGSHCIRCGVEYESLTRPQCECAGDPPVDKAGIEYEGYLNRVQRLRHDRG